MKLSFRWYGEDDKVTLENIRQIPGMQSIVTAVYDVPVGEVWSRESIAGLKKQVEDAGLGFDVIESIPVHEDIKLGKDTRDKYIANYCENYCIYCGFNCYNHIKRMKLNVAPMHSDLKQEQREEVMLDFKNGKIDVLVATDIVARGIDIEDIGLVINYDVPHDPEDYIHRIGRTGRAKKHGVAYTLLSDFPSRLRLDNIARNTRSTIVPAVLGEDGSVTVGEK